MSEYHRRCRSCLHQFAVEMTPEDFIDADSIPCPECQSESRSDVPSAGGRASDLGAAAKARFDSMYPYVSRRLPRNMPGCRLNEKGQPVIESRQHERRIMAEHGYIRE